MADHVYRRAFAGANSIPLMNTVSTSTTAALCRARHKRGRRTAAAKVPRRHHRSARSRSDMASPLPMWMATSVQISSSRIRSSSSGTGIPGRKRWMALGSAFVMAENLTPKDNVCIAAQDIDGDGKCEVAVGARMESWRYGKQWGGLLPHPARGPHAALGSREAACRAHGAPDAVVQGWRARGSSSCCLCTGGEIATAKVRR